MLGGKICKVLCIQYFIKCSGTYSLEMVYLQEVGVVVIEWSSFMLINPSKKALVFTCLKYKSFENIVEKRRNCSQWAISSFPTVFSTRTFCHFQQSGSCLQTFSIWKSLRFSFGKGLMLPHIDTFWRPLETNLLKTLREKEKLLVTSNFSFTHSVFYQFRELSSISIKFKIVVCRLSQFGPV